MIDSTKEPETCTKCGRTKRVQQQGSFTQWLFDAESCNCSLKVDDSADSQIQLCKICGKRLASDRVGSLTQWIFRADTCSCGWNKNVPVAQLENTTEVESIEQVVVDRKLTAQLNLPGDRYGVIEIIGAGSFAMVYKCWDHLLNKTVAIKVLACSGADDVIRFQNEARLTSKLADKHIVATLDFGTTSDGKPYMVMEHIKGTSLSDLLKENSDLSFSSIVDIISQICEGMSHAHAKGVLHRDLKTSNIMIINQDDRSLQVRIIDFGIAAVVDAGTAASDRSEEVIGTPNYMSPESARGEEIDQRSDIYSLGCILFEALSGNPPFSGESALATLTMHQFNPIPLLSETNPDLENVEQLDELLSKALAKDPFDRFDSMQSFQQALLALANATSSGSAGSDALPKMKSQIFPYVIVLTAILIVVPVVILFVNTSNETDESAVRIKHKKSGNDRLSNLSDTTVKGLFALSGVDNVDTSDASLEKELKIDSNRTNMNLSGAQITDKGLDAILKLPLRSIDLCSTEITDLGIKKISTIKSLRTVRLAGCRKISGRCLSDLAQLPLLETLWIGNTVMNDDDLKLLSNCKSLQCISISYNRRMNGSGVQYLAKLPLLNSLWAAGIDFNLDGIKAVSSLKQLRELIICGNSNIDDRALKYLNQLDHLEILDLSRTQISDKGLRHLSGMINLKTLRIIDCPRLTAKGDTLLGIALPQCRINSGNRDSDR